MPEGQSQRSVASSMQHQQEAEVAAAEERERAAVETAATAARATGLAMAELAATRVEVEAAAVANAARVAVVELEALRANSTGNSVSANDDRDNELKLASEAAREQVAQWAAAHSQGRRGSNPDRCERAGGAPGGACVAAVSPTAAGAQTGADAASAGLTEITVFTCGAILPPQIGTMVTMRSRPLSGMSVPTADDLPSPRPTTLSGPQ
jgi:hypothetical protein